MTEIIYLGVPYSHDDPEIEEQRFQEVSKYGAELSRQGVIVFSPVSMAHPMKLYGLPGGWEFWKKFDEVYLGICSSLRILCLDGWEDSTGLKAEVRMMEDLGKPIEYVHKEGDLYIPGKPGESS